MTKELEALECSEWCYRWQLLPSTTDSSIVNKNKDVRLKKKALTPPTADEACVSVDELVLIVEAKRR